MQTRAEGQTMQLGPHATHILIAEFDVDEGNVLRHQYPQATGTDEHLLAELMLPDGVHARSEDWTIFMLSTNGALARPQITTSPSIADGEGLLYAINLVRTKHDDTVRRGALVKAMAIVTPHHWLHVYKPLLALALDDYLSDPCVEILQNVYRSINEMHTVKINLTFDQRMILRNTNQKDLFDSADDDYTFQDNRPKALKGSQGPPARSVHKDSRFLEREIHYQHWMTKRDIPVPIKVPLGSMPDEIGEYSLISFFKTFASAQVSGPSHPHLNTGTFPKDVHPLVILFNAIITNKRVLFIGVGHAAQEVSNCVLAAAALASGCGLVLGGFISRLWPYTNLSNVDDLLKVPGYIAGTTNPSYEAHSSWWDLLCNVKTGQIIVSKDIDKTATNMQMGKMKFSDSKSRDSNSPDSLQNSDALFVEEILGYLQAHYGEMHIRARVQEYVTHFIRLCAAFEQDFELEERKKLGPLSFESCLFYEGDVSTSSDLGRGLYHYQAALRRKELQLNSARIQGFLHSAASSIQRRRFHIFLASRKLRSPVQPFDPIDTEYQLFRLRKGSNVPAGEVSLIFQVFAANMQSSEQIIELAAHLSSFAGGPSNLIVGLFHPSPTVRDLATHIYNAMSKHTVVSKLMGPQTMNVFHRLAIVRALAPFKEIDEYSPEQPRGTATYLNGSQTNGIHAANERRRDNDEYEAGDIATDLHSRPLNMDHKLDSFGSNLGRFSLTDTGWY